MPYGLTLPYRLFLLHKLLKTNVMKAKKIFALLLVGTMVFSCAKEEDIPVPVEEPASSPGGSTGGGNTTGNAQPSFAGADASLWAVKSLSVTTVAGQTITTTIGTGVATFIDGSSNFIGAGTVKLNTNTLTQNPNNSYVFTAGISMPTGIDFSGGVAWDVAGGNGYSAFTKNVTLGFPTVSAVTSSGTITKANGYTVSVNTVTGADSVLFLVGGVNKTIAGNANSCFFSSSELSSLSNGTTVVQVAAYTSTNETVGGKVIYYGNETVQTKTTTVE